MTTNILSRREALRTGALVAGGLALGTVAGTATAKRGGTGFLRNDPPIEHGLERGDTFTIVELFDQPAEALSVECEASGRTRENVFSVYETDLPFRLLLWVKGSGPVDAPLTVEVTTVRECGLMTEVAGSFVGDAVTFKPA